MAAKERRRCFFDVTIDGELAGRVVMELYDDITPITAENFLQLCTGQAGTGKTTGKHLSYKGSLFHRVVKNFMIQGGDFTAGNGTGGESVYGGTFDDENFRVKHDQPFILSMANRGPNTNGSQFFITTNKAPHLNDVHVAFGRVVSGQEVVARIEQLKTGPKNRPISDVIISNCGQMVKVSVDGEEERTSEKKKKHKKHKRSKSKDKNSDGDKTDEEAERIKIESVSSVKPEDLPLVPETNKFLLRESRNNDDAKRNERSRIRSSHRSSRRSRSRSPRRDRSGIKVKGRGRLLYRSPSREGSRTPPHWKAEQSRLISMEEIKRIQVERQEKADAEELAVEDEKDAPEQMAPKFVRSEERFNEHDECINEDREPARTNVPLSRRHEEDRSESRENRRHRQIVYDVEDEPRHEQSERINSRKEHKDREKSESKKRHVAHNDERERRNYNEHRRSPKDEFTKHQRECNDLDTDQSQKQDERRAEGSDKKRNNDENRTIESEISVQNGDRSDSIQTTERHNKKEERQTEIDEQQHNTIYKKSDRKERRKETEKRSRDTIREHREERKLENDDHPQDTPEEERSHRQNKRREQEEKRSHRDSREQKIREDKRKDHETRRSSASDHKAVLHREDPAKQNEEEKRPSTVNREQNSRTDEKTREDIRREDERNRKECQNQDRSVDDRGRKSRGFEKSDYVAVKDNRDTNLEKREDRNIQREQSLDRPRRKHGDKEAVEALPSKPAKESRKRSPEPQKKAFTTMTANAEVSFLASIVPTPASAPVVYSDADITILPVAAEEKAKDSQGTKRHLDLTGAENSPPKSKQRRDIAERRSSPHRSSITGRRGDRSPQRFRRSPPRRPSPRRSPYHRRRSPSPRRYDRRHRSPDRRRSPPRRRSPDDRQRNRRRSRSTSSSSSSSGSSTSSSSPSSRSSSSS